MSLQLKDSVILITSSDSSRKDFGTGFIIHRDEQAAYVLTCAHVVKKVGESERVIADGIPAKVIALGEDDGFDLAVLRVEEPLEKPVFSLGISGEKGKHFIVAGHYSPDNKTILSKQISGKLGQQIGLVSRGRKERTNAWDLEIDGNYYLQPGYSGSPLVDETIGAVFGVVSHQQGKGEKGLAISIEALAKIWQEMPSALLDRNEQQTFEGEDNLSSERGVDYARLRDLLADEKWKEADRETAALMLKVVGKEQQGWLRIEDLEKFPCTDLRTIDTLWVKYSKGHFGLSVQKRIWLELGGRWDSQTEYALGARLGWRVQDKWLCYSELTFSPNALEGNLPAWGRWVSKSLGLFEVFNVSGSFWGVGVVTVGLKLVMGTLLSRAEACKL